jgi:hypothetical protein
MRRFVSSLLLVLCGTFLGALLGLVARQGIESLLAMAVVGTIVAAVAVELGPRAWSLLVTRLPVELRSPITRRGRDTIAPQEPGPLEDLAAPPDFQAIHTGSSVTLEVTNSGPAALFRAEVIEVRGTEDDNAGVTPWAIRWRDSTEGDQRIMRGQTQVLNLVELNHQAVQTLLEGHYTAAPFVFQRIGGSGVWGLRAGLDARDRSKWNRIRVCVRIRLFRAEPDRYWDYGVRFGWAGDARIVDPSACEPVPSR